MLFRPSGPGRLLMPALTRLQIACDQGAIFARATSRLLQVDVSAPFSCIPAAPSIAAPRPGRHFRWPPRGSDVSTPASCTFCAPLTWRRIFDERMSVGLDPRPGARVGSVKGIRIQPVRSGFMSSPERRSDLPAPQTVRIDVVAVLVITGARPPVTTEGGGRRNRLPGP
jgi:hypothetical protein